ncbi:hypothetical protein F5148DRAFT_1379995 [Russula earlei]|uniref:Uncharacterized protein n=1 Tax=Russula earlei TaxID=71964 RepID=A0ACC0TS77_9AGAM|nr:hypothetical protein F5148DRAFT_1379995 [Russula earlei]
MTTISTPTGTTSLLSSLQGLAQATKELSNTQLPTPLQRDTSPEANVIRSTSTESNSKSLYGMGMGQVLPIETC